MKIKVNRKLPPPSARVREEAFRLYAQVDKSWKKKYSNEKIAQMLSAKFDLHIITKHVTAWAQHGGWVQLIKNAVQQGRDIAGEFITQKKAMMDTAISMYKMRKKGGGKACVNKAGLFDVSETLDAYRERAKVLHKVISNAATAIVDTWHVNDIAYQALTRRNKDGELALPFKSRMEAHESWLATQKMLLEIYGIAGLKDAFRNQIVVNANVSMPAPAANDGGGVTETVVQAESFGNLSELNHVTILKCFAESKGRRAGGGNQLPGPEDKDFPGFEDAVIVGEGGADKGRKAKKAKNT